MDKIANTTTTTKTTTTTTSSTPEQLAHQDFIGVYPFNIFMSSSIVSRPSFTTVIAIPMETTRTSLSTVTTMKEMTGTVMASTVGAIAPTTTTTTSTESLFMSLNMTTNQTLRIKEYPALANFHGEYDLEYIARINSFWLSFDPPSPRSHYIMAVIYIIITTIGCFGNALVVYMFIRCKSLRTHANTLVINLAVSDFFMLAKCPIAIYNSFKLGPALGDLGCRLYGFFGGLTGTVSIITLTAIAVDRYNVVVYPLDPYRSSTKLRSRLLVCFIWLYSFFFAVIPSLDIGLSTYVPEGYLTTCSFDYLTKSIPARIFMFMFFVGAWCIPFSIISYCYFYILRVVSNASGIQSSKDCNKTEIKLTGIVIGVIGLWFVAWTPYSVVALLGISGNENLITPLGSMIPAIFCKTSACIDPYIYAITHPRFRMEFRRMFFGERYIRRCSTYRSSFPTRCSTSRRRRMIRDVELNINNSNSLKKISENSAEDDFEQNCSLNV
ncbi:opsin, ultraviolet-sensitive [Episyrphus balteatus]|uniref:opsin, ultraviolet-sensitive n=1 Tax=Episyrphus balteatus TaxID=286459 RepID=UPI002485A0DF|nr:opsin, ultraviolet-sensitive [Episyrphus balteatus]XP_055846891.1 opsin, ultraviolet-sensitive [Episyrphus balteatus]